MSESGLIEVRVRDCACPDTPHEQGDLVYLLPSLSLEGGAAAELDLLDTQDIEDEKRRTFALLARWTVTYVRYGAVGWNWLRLNEREKPEPIPFDVEVLLRDYSLSRAVAEKAAELYSEAVISPLMQAASSSPTGLTESPTSPTRASTRKRSGSSSRPGSAGRPLRAVG